MLVEKGLSREKSYDTVQPLAMKSWEEKRPFRELVEGDDVISGTLSAEEIDDAFDLNHHTRRVDEIFKRVGL
jgi:adenylosuccinate lyase